ncbi:hypothetical protein LTR95_007905 [Oleoguttula sp. CCFEE 5521]
MSSPEMTNSGHVDIKAKDLVEQKVETKSLDQLDGKSAAALLETVKDEIYGGREDWLFFEFYETQVLRVVRNQDVLLLKDGFVQYWLELADDILEIVAKARAVIEYYVGEPEKQNEVIALTAKLRQAGEEIELAKKHAAAVKGVAEIRVSYDQLVTLLRLR